VKAALLFQASAILRLLQEVRAMALRKVLVTDFTLLTFHRSTPVPVKEDAPKKVPYKLLTEDVIHALTSLLNAAASEKVDCMLVTEDVFHALTSPLNAAAMTKVRSMLVAEDVSHLLMSPLNVVALGLPLLPPYSPASLRSMPKARWKEGTPLVSQSSIGPHLVTEVDGELTTSHVASVNSAWVRGCARAGEEGTE